MTKIFTRRVNAALLLAMTVVGLALVVLVRDPWTGTLIFLDVTAVQGWIFTAFYGLASTWRTTAAGRALFWIILTYTLIATQVVIAHVFRIDAEWFEDVRQVLYLALSVSGLNLLLTMVRLVSEREAPGE